MPLSTKLEGTKKTKRIADKNILQKTIIKVKYFLMFYARYHCINEDLWFLVRALFLMLSQ